VYLQASRWSTQLNVLLSKAQIAKQTNQADDLDNKRKTISVALEALIVKLDDIANTRQWEVRN
jgi:hypothetical protein